jgi:hypothetical protein
MARLGVSLAWCAAAAGLMAACGATPTTPSSAAAEFELTLTSTTLPAGGSTQATITLNRVARSAVVVTLSTSDAAASVPGSITVPSGARIATFNVATRLVAADTPVRIAASVGGSTQEVMLQVVSPVSKPPTLDSFVLAASLVRGGQSVEGTVKLSGAAPQGGALVRIGSSNGAAIVPATVTITSGTLSATFVIDTRPVALDTHVEITASYLDQTRTVPLGVTP